MEAPPPVLRPRYALKQVFALRDRLFQAVDEFRGFVLEDDVFRDAVKAAACLLTEVSTQVIRDSFLPLAGQLLTPDAVFHWAWRMAGNLPKLRAGVAALPLKIG